MDLVYTRALTPARRLAPKRQPFIVHQKKAKRNKDVKCCLEHGMLALLLNMWSSLPSTCDRRLVEIGDAI
jgi:hypothetical protein